MHCVQSQMFVRGIAEIAEVLVGFKRLQNFLLLDEKVTKRICEDKNGHNGYTGEKGDVSLHFIHL